MAVDDVVEEVAGRRRSVAQRLLIGANCLLIVGSLALVGTAGYFYTRIGNIPRIDLADGVLGPLEGEPDAAPSLEPQNYLLVGSDTREGQDPERFGTTEDSAGARADTMILVRVDPREETAAIVSFPRDLWLPIYDPGGEALGEQRINTAFERGPEGLIATIRHNFDIPVHHYAQVNFAGFRDLVEAVGGVEIFLAGPVRDRNPEDGSNRAALDIDQSGCVELNGDQALAYVRSRYFQQYVDGQWQADPTGDLGRIQRQQDFVRRAVREALSEGLSNPIEVNQLIDVAEDNVVVDRGFDGSDLVSLGQRFRSLTPDNLNQRSLVVEHWRTPGGAAVLRLVDDPANEVTFDIFRGIDRPAETISPASVQVRVLNGTGRAGEASEASEELLDAGFPVVGVGDGSFGTEVTTIRYGAGQEVAADLLARHLVAPGARLVLDPALTVDLVLVTGDDYEGVLDVPRPADEPPAPEEPAAPADAETETTGDGGGEPPAPEC